jgi:3-oxoacyl-ACP reductase-like protein
MLEVPLREAVESMEEGEVEAEMVTAEVEEDPAPTEAAAAEAPEITPAAEDTPPAAAVAPAPDIMPIAGGLIAVGLLVALVGTIVSIRRGRKPRTATQASEEDDTESEA